MSHSCEFSVYETLYHHHQHHRWLCLHAGNALSLVCQENCSIFVMLPAGNNTDFFPHSSAHFARSYGSKMCVDGTSTNVVGGLCFGMTSSHTLKVIWMKCTSDWKRLTFDDDEAS